MKLRLMLWRCGCGVRTFFTTTRRLETKPPFNILFFGTDSFALETLTALQKNRLNTSEGRVVDKLDVVSTSQKSAVSKFAEKQDLRLLTWPPDLGDLDAYDLGVLVSFGRLVPRKVIAKLPYGILNVHPSLLPRWRGASPIMHTVLNSDADTGVSIMSIQPKHFDTGPIIQQTRMAVPEGCTAQSLGNVLAKEGASLLVETLQAMPDVLHKAKPQSSEGVTYAHKASASMALIDWKQHTSQQIQQQYRALAGMFPLRTTWNGEPVKLADMVLEDVRVPSVAHRGSGSDSSHSDQHVKTSDAHGSQDGGGMVEAGTVVYDPQSKAICVKCLDGWVAFLSVILKKRMSASDFYNGYLSKDKHKGVCFESHPNGLFSSQYFDFVHRPKAKKS
ncbi:methionyl-tRNA formyltransferase, mitochondrial-like [Littorina saxatilis]|uniref:Methionyl-tRNA formyltransferase, mitochondrial n=1 Tax=Littorina saxatilis TaxID=31220 RepID=A0AAN9AZV0_9CAEN